MRNGGISLKHAGHGKTEKVVCNLFCLAAIAAFLTILAVRPARDTSYMDAVRFVQAWNVLAQEKDDLTLGVKISDRPGLHMVRLGNGAFLCYRVIQTGLFQRGIPAVVYKNIHFTGSAKTAVDRILSLVRKNDIRIAAPAKWEKAHGLLFTYDCREQMVKIFPVMTNIPSQTEKNVLQYPCRIQL